MRRFVKHGLWTIHIFCPRRHLSANVQLVNSSSSATHQPAFRESIPVNAILYKHPNAKTLRRGYYFAGLWLVFWSVLGVLQGVDYERKRRQLLEFALKNGLALDQLRGEKAKPFMVAFGMMAMGLFPMIVVHRVCSK
jgi:hypothetical protein